MLKDKNLKSLVILTWISALITTIISLASILKIDLYKPMTPDKMLPGAMGQDIISLLAALLLIPLLLKGLKGSNKDLLIWAGLIGYLFYAYALYSFEAVYTILYPGYIAITGLTLFMLIIFFVNLDLKFFSYEKFKGFPRRSMSFFFIFFTLLLTTIWSGMIMEGIKTQTRQQANTVFILDLSFILPLFMIAAIGLIRKKNLGYMLTGILCVKIFTLAFSVFLSEVLRKAFNQPLEFSMIILFGVLSLGGLIFAILYFRKI